MQLNSRSEQPLWVVQLRDLLKWWWVTLWHDSVTFVHNHHTQGDKGHNWFRYFIFNSVISNSNFTTYLPLYPGQVFNLSVPHFFICKMKGTFIPILQESILIKG